LGTKEKGRRLTVIAETGARSTEMSGTALKM
jgi:hypothetical protein